MTTNNANPAGMSSEINVTPLIDVLLVLLIVFMVIVPVMSKGEAALAPKPALHDVSDGATVVLEVLKGSGHEAHFKINGQDVARQDLPERLAAIYANRSQRVLFVKGDDELSFTQVAEAIDIGHAAGVERIGMITPGVHAGL